MAHCFKVPIELTLALIPFDMHLSQERSDEEMPARPPPHTHCEMNCTDLQLSLLAKTLKR